MQQFLSSDPPSASVINSALEDFGFWHEFSDVSLMYAEYINNKRYAYDGGVLDQPEEYWDDMATMRWLELWVKHVASLPRLDQVSVFDTLRSDGRLDGSWMRRDNGK